MTKVEAPNSAYEGPGPGGAVFEKGVADVEDEAALNYYRSAGYTVGGEREVEPVVTEPEDPRKVAEEVVGTRLRDAAVDPEVGDFLAPTNAGQGNPHGSTVVSPQVHASSGVRPGEVLVEDAAKQGERESAYAAARLVQRLPADEVVAQEVPDADDRGDLDLSDPGSAEAGRKAADDGQADEPEPKPARKTAARKKA